MRKRFLSSLLVGILGASLIQAQIVSTFETLTLNPESHWDGASATLGMFQTELPVEGAVFNNQYSRNDWGFGITEAWSGFAYSKVSDNTTPGYGNQYSCIAGSGADGSANYGVFYVGFGPETVRFDTPAVAQNILVCNATYTYFSMRDGDAFSKIFGGNSGNDPDYLLLTIIGLRDGATTDTINFYLADYRAEDNSNDYLIDDWTNIDLRSLGEVDALQFSLSSSDTGDWGMNTPGYFCIDNLNEVDFESLTYTSGDYWNGASAALGNYGTVFADGPARFSNSYTLSDWGYGLSGFWTGWAYSNSSDNTTAGYANAFSAISGSGVNGSDTYALCYNNRKQDTITLESAYKALGVYVTNGTYPYLSMRDGDSFAKKFGGDSGDDEDFFLLKILGWLNGQITDTVDFYLADYRFTDNSQDYLINDWTWVDLSPLGQVDQLTFSLSSSDMGDWGMNTPAYFFIDDLSLAFTENIREEKKITSLKMYPNPAVENITISSSETIDNISILSFTGQMIRSIANAGYGNELRVNISDLRPGHYLIQVRSGKKTEWRKLVKQ
ncbi:MAG: DUF4465 domain-containing protein [Bacteroidales bacterium]|nr:DUF4465 domain-containing protein [Bacteroidales bacterium]